MSGPARADVAVLIYHRFGETNLPSTNIKISQFEDHITAIKTGDYLLLSSAQLAHLLETGDTLPDQALVLTVDDAFRSFKTEAWPRLKEAGIPVTLFVATDRVDQASIGGTYLTWPELRELSEDGVTIGHHGAAHAHLIRTDIKDAIADIQRASKVFERELGFVPDIFAYPYGEYDETLKNWLSSNGFRISFAQYSSAVGKYVDHHAIPRFPMNERFGNMDRFRLVSRAKALPAIDILPRDPKIADPRDNPPLFGFTVTEPVTGLENLRCYPSFLGGEAKIEQLSFASGATRVEVRFNKAMPAGRSRINCTLSAGNGRWYWFGRPFFVPGGALN